MYPLYTHIQSQALSHILYRKTYYHLYRSSHRRCSVRKSVLRNFAKSTGKYLCQSFFFNKIEGLSPDACNFIKKEILAQVLSCEFPEISKNTFFTEHLRKTASAFNWLSDPAKRISICGSTKSEAVIKKCPGNQLVMNF